MDIKRFNLISLISLVSTVSTFAYDFKKDGLYYNVLSNKTCELTYIYNSYTDHEKINIPSQVEYNGNKYVVSSIGDGTFMRCYKLKSINIPKTINHIGKDAFSECHRLKNVYIEDLSAWCKIDFEDTPFGKEFYDTPNFGNMLYLNNELITNLVIPNDVSAISNHAFYCCKDITNVSLHNNITSIGSCAFAKCKELTEITLPSKLKRIENRTFDGCSKLTSIMVPNSVVYIGECAFYGCKFLVSITIPQSVKSIERSAFSNCTGLYSVEISDLKAWCDIDFGADGNPLRYAEQFCINGKIITNLEIPSGVKCIKNYAFGGYKALSSVKIPNSVTEIGDYAFFDTNLASINIPNSVLSIGNHSFDNCKMLQTVTVPNSVTSIGNGAFYNCSGLTSVSISSSVTRIGCSAFWQCRKIVEINLNNSITEIGTGAFSACPNIKTVRIQDISSWIETCAKSNNQIFDSKYDIVVKDQKLKELVIPENITDIPKYCFSNCSSLEKVTLHRNMKNIGFLAFKGNIKNVICHVIAPPNCDLGSDGRTSPWGGSIGINYLYVPDSSVKLYKQTFPWNYFKVYGISELTDLDKVDRADKISIIPKHDGFYISGAKYGEVVYVYNIDGKLLNRSIATDEETFIECPEGFVIVNVGDKRVKVKI